VSSPADPPDIEIWQIARCACWKRRYNVLCQI